MSEEVVIQLIKDKITESKTQISYYSNLRSFINISQIIVSTFSVIISSVFLSDTIPINIFEYIILTSTIIQCIISGIQSKYPYALKMKKLKSVLIKFESLFLEFDEMKKPEIINCYEKLNIELSKISNSISNDSNNSPKIEV